MLEVKVFDGSDTGDKIYETTTYIGHSTTAPVAEKAAQIPELANMERWPVSISYFEAGKKDKVRAISSRSTSTATAFHAL